LVLKREIYELNSRTIDDTKVLSSTSRDLQTRIRKLPELSGWGFVVEDFRPEIMGISLLFFVYSSIKEFLTIFFILTFIGFPLLQLIPSMILSFAS